jgi:outer membrane protein assembly factor BamA
MKRDRAKAPRRTHRNGNAARPARLLIPLLAALFAALPSVVPAAQAPEKTAKVASVKVIGSKRFASEELARAIGLAPGTVVTKEDIQTGADKLTKLGWFSQVSYKFQGNAKGVDIEFTLMDAPAAPLWFDNFPWFTDAEIAAAIRAAGVLYDGTAPESGTVLDSIREAVAALLKSHNIPGEVEGEMTQAPESDGMVERFRVLGADLRVTSLEFSDAIARNDPGLTHSTDAVVGKSYSRYELAVFLGEQVRPLYTSKGYLRVHFGEPVALFAGDPSKPLPNEIALRVTIEPGVLYHWGGATWNGQSALNAATLDGLLGLKANDPADAQRIEGAWERVTREYGKRGYIEAKVEPAPQYDEAGARVSYAVHIAEGTEYRMGQLVLTGLSLESERKLLSNWKLPRGDVFDDAYYEDFVTEGAPKIFKDTPVHFTRVGHLLRPNPQTKTVDVLLDFQ